MERPRRLSIEPYVESGAHFSAQIAVNSEAASKVMKAVDLDRDVYVTKRPDHEIQWLRFGLGPQVGTFERFPSRIESTLMHDVLKSHRTFIIGVDDEVLAAVADSQVRRRYKRHGEESGDEMLRGEFLKGFNKEVSNGIKAALKEEKVTPRGDQGRNYVYYGLTGLAVWGFESVTGGDVLDGSTLRNVLGTWAIAPTTMYALEAITGTDIVKPRKGLEFALPLVPVDRYVRGYWQIMRNQGKLIVDKERVQARSIYRSQ